MTHKLGRFGAVTSRCSLKLAPCLVMSIVLGCNDHPLQLLESIVTATNRQENRMPAKTKIDFLLVVDNSNSMCQEQDNLTKNFSTFSNFLFDELEGSADYRIAVVSTDMSPTNEDRGHFLAKPAIKPEGFAACRSVDEFGVLVPKVPDTADCEGLDLKPVLRSDELLSVDGDNNEKSKADLERKFRCMATLGVEGDGYEKGLEAMRYALSCTGPNVQYFDQCCVQDAKDPAGRRRVFNPGCAVDAENGGEPEFLRPDALLVVIFVSDENDCSDPAANPNESRRVICRYDFTQDQNRDDVPDGYNDQVLCAGKTPQKCFTDECGSLSPQDCYSRRCEVDATNNYNCEYGREHLTPVGDYFEFLNAIKARPAEQLVVATIVGQRDYTPSGSEIFFNEGVSAAASGVACVPDRDLSDPEVLVNREAVRSEMCCPQGQCRGDVISTCVSKNGSAYAGRRYLELADRFADNGIGCPRVRADEVSETMVAQCTGIFNSCPADIAVGTDEMMIQQQCAGGVNISRPYQVNDRCGCSASDPSNCRGKCRPIEGTGTLACSPCLSICEDSFSAPLLAIKAKVAEVLAAYCLDKVPACYVASESEARECRTPEEFASSTNYPIRVVRRQCATPTDEMQCQRSQNTEILPASEWYLELNQDACPGGARLRLRDPPPAGSEIFVEFYVSFDGDAASGAQGSTAGSDAPASPVGGVERSIGENMAPAAALAPSAMGAAGMPATSESVAGMRAVFESVAGMRAVFESVAGITASPESAADMSAASESSAGMNAASESVGGIGGQVQGGAGEGQP